MRMPVSAGLRLHPGPGHGSRLLSGGKTEIEMATIVLTTVGTLIGGPIGGAIGAIAGSAIDNAVFGSSSGREGPRLKELDVQTSSYGSNVPAIFGKMRVAGTVFWATDLQERKSKKKGGKGKPSVTTYTYSVSLAVALSSGPIKQIGRIWADGNLLRGAAGDFKSETGFRFYPGSGNQPIDPLIASDVGPSNCSAHRNIAYVVFEDLQLADFGNRIPQMTFEIVEREDDVPLGDIFGTISRGVIAGDVAVSVQGFAAEGSSARAALQPLAENCPISIFLGDDILQLHDWSKPVTTQPVQIAAQHNSRDLDPALHSLARADEAPTSIKLKHYEPARDYQLGVQQSQRAGDGFANLSIELPASIDAVTAKGFADSKLLDVQLGQSGFTGSVVLGDMPLRPGDWFTDKLPMRISEIEHSRGYSMVTARDAAGQYAVDLSSAKPGAHMAAADELPGLTRIIVMDLPALDSSNRGQPLVAIAAAGTQPGWRGANLSLRQGDNLIDLGGTAGPAAIGSLAAPIAGHHGNMVDTRSSIIINMLHDGMEIPQPASSVLAADAPAIWINGEIIRYGSVDDTGPQQFALGNLLRGSLATEEFIAGHAAGSEVVFLEEDTLRFVEPRYLQKGTMLAVEAIGIGDETPQEAMTAIVANALTPRRPVHARMEKQPGGARIFRWARRPRVDGGWQDSVDQPLAEEQEQYRFQIISAGQTIFESTPTAPQQPFTAQDWAALNLPANSAATVRISQTGSYGMSPPATITGI